jgi:inner membrane protein
MDGLTHSLFGLTSAKAGLDRLSPLATTSCVLCANAPDIDVVAFFFGGRPVLLEQHRGITHSIVGTLMLGLLIPTILFGIDRGIARWRKRPPRIRYLGLCLASLLASASHPLMDWTNNYGVRPLLPWSGRWFYGDLVFIIDPYLLIMLGTAAFLLTAAGRWKMMVWALLALAMTVVVMGVSPQRAAGVGGLTVARIIWLGSILILIIARLKGVNRRVSRSLAWGSLACVLCYWGGLGWAHHAAYLNAESEARSIATRRGENFIRVAATPTAANPFQWLCIAETDRAMYRFFVGVKAATKLEGPTLPNVDNESAEATAQIERYPKPTGRGLAMVSQASQDRGAQALLSFARFPIARVENINCTGETLVQFADLRYTEPGSTRGSFGLSVPVRCPSP